MGTAIDIAGRTYGRLTVIAPEGIDSNGSVLWRCECACGNTCMVPAGDLTSGSTVSCGCRRAETEHDNLVAYRERAYYEGTKLDALTPGKLHHNNVSGVRGVVPSRNGKRWIAQIKLRGKSRCLGTYDTIEQAAAARHAAERELYDPILRDAGSKK